MQTFPQQVRHVITQLKNVAIVGLSDDPSRDSYMVGSFLKKAGYNVIPVNPRVPTVLGVKSFPDLQSAYETMGEIDVVDIFRSPEYIPNIVQDAIDIGAKVVWMQLDLLVPEAAEMAEKAGLFVVMNKCMKIEHMKLND